MKAFAGFNPVPLLLVFAAALFGGCATANSIKKIEKTPIVDLKLPSAPSTNIVPTSRAAVINGVRFSHVYSDMGAERFEKSIQEQTVPYRIATSEEKEKFLAEVGALPQFGNVASYIVAPISQDSQASTDATRKVPERIVRTGTYADIDAARYFLLYSNVEPEELSQKLKTLHGSGYKIASAEYEQAFQEKMGVPRQYPGMKPYIVRSLGSRDVNLILSTPGIRMNGTNYMYGYFHIDKVAIERAQRDGLKLSPGWRLATDEETQAFEQQMVGREISLEKNRPEITSVSIRYVVAIIPKKDTQTVAAIDRE